MFNRWFIVILATFMTVLAPVQVQAAKLQPYSLAKTTQGELDKVAAEVRTKLTSNGFQVVGTYAPYQNTRILIVTSNYLRKMATKSTYGGFGSVLKVAVTDVEVAPGKRELQISYNNPNYFGLAYNMSSKLEPVKDDLTKALGFVRDYGGGEGIEETELPDYNYTFGLEGFYGFFELAKFRSYEEAIQKVENGLASNEFGIKKVFRVDVPGKKQTIYGIGMLSNPEKQPFLNDKYVMNIIDYKKLRGSAHLPYELMVNGNSVIALHPHFRLAINFPELHMFGENSFGKLMDLPYVYEEFITRAIGGKWPREEQF